MNLLLMRRSRVPAALLLGLVATAFLHHSHGFFLDKFDRIKKIAFPNFSGLSSLLPSLTGMNPSKQGVRVCINFSSQTGYPPQGYQQNTCFLCDAYRFNSIAYYCTGQSAIPSSINYTQANCIMNTCQPMYQRYPLNTGLQYPTGTIGTGSSSIYPVS